MIAMNIFLLKDKKILNFGKSVKPGTGAQRTVIMSDAHVAVIV